MKKTAAHAILILLAVIFVMLSVSCGSPDENQTFASTATSLPPTRTPFPPSPTPIPSAAVVNGEIITLSTYQEELARYKAAVNRELTEEDRERVIEDLIDRTLLAQAASGEGFQISEEELTARIETLTSDNQPITDWLANFGYTEESFRENYLRSLAAAWMRDKIIAEVPQQTEQIRAQQILLYDQAQAETVFQSLESGSRFEELAANYDPQTRGYLGWFPRGFLTIPELDEILFNQDVGEYSDIIETEIGYHIIKILDKEASKVINPAVRMELQKKALQNWLERRRKLSTINLTLP
ncbi:MAG: peptidylprolyl isomerase [Anaerolineales bacterium]|nr:peptidylprolyl isomerase [Anaerolineales bacterium]